MLNISCLILFIGIYFDSDSSLAVVYCVVLIELLQKQCFYIFVPSAARV